MSSGGTNRTSAGNDVNQAISGNTAVGSAFNTQLQSILGGVQASPVAGTGSTAANNLTSIAATGGYTPTQVSAMKDEATGAAEGAYSTASDTYSRAVAASGGYGPSSAATSSLARQGANAGSTAATNVDATIAQGQVGNQLAANSGLTSLAGINATQQQQILNTIMGNNYNTGSLNNQSINTAAGIATTPNPLWGNIASIIGAL